MLSWCSQAERYPSRRGAGRPDPWLGGQRPAAGPAPLDPPLVPVAAHLLVADGSRLPGGGRDRLGVAVEHPQRPWMALYEAAVALIVGAESSSGPRLAAEVGVDALRIQPGATGCGKVERIDWKCAALLFPALQAGCRWFETGIGHG